MAMVHEFALFSKETTISFDKIAHESCCTIHDYLICYIFDTLNWIKTLSYDNIEQQGLCYTGITIFEGISLYQLINILKAWHNLFTLAQDTIVLKGEYSIAEEKFTRIEVQKIEVLSQIADIIALTEKAAYTDERIIHFGL